MNKYIEVRYQLPDKTYQTQIRCRTLDELRAEIVKGLTYSRKHRIHLELKGDATNEQNQ